MNLAHMIIAVILGFIAAVLVSWITDNDLLAKTIMLIIIFVFPVHCRLYELEQKLKRLGLKL